MNTMISILKNELSRRKGAETNYSVRAFAKDLGISPSQLSQLMSGKRPFTIRTLAVLTRRLNLSQEKAELVRDSLLSEKGFFPSQLRVDRTEFQSDQFHLIADWYHLAILSLIKLKGSKPDPRWLSKRLNIKIEEAQRALFRLKKLGIISLNPFKQISDFFEVSSKVPSEAIQKFHRQNLILAIDKLSTIPPSRRQFQTVSINIPDSRMSEFTKLINNFLDSALELEQNSSASEVYHLNVQLFPVTSRKDTPK